MSRLVVSVPLLENARERALQLLSEGPPFELAETAFERTTAIAPTGRRSSSSRGPGRATLELPG
jgi:hypothetical protein